MLIVKFYFIYNFYTWLIVMFCIVVSALYVCNITKTSSCVRLNVIGEKLSLYLCNYFVSEMPTLYIPIIKQQCFDTCVILSCVPHERKHLRELRTFICSFRLPGWCG